MTYPKATHCPKCNRKLKARCPRAKWARCLECEDGCVRADQARQCRRCQYEQQATYRHERKANVGLEPETPQEQRVEQRARQAMDRHSPWTCGSFSLSSLGVDGVKLTYENGDETEAVLLDREQVTELREWLEAR
jgi:hypothetical protein